MTWRTKRFTFIYSGLNWISDWVVLIERFHHQNPSIDQTLAPQETSSGTFGWLNRAGQDLAGEGEGEPALLKDYLKHRRMRSVPKPLVERRAEIKQHRSRRLLTAGGATNLLLIAHLKKKPKKKKTALWLVSRPVDKIFYETLSLHKVAILPFPPLCSKGRLPPAETTAMRNRIRVASLRGLEPVWLWARGD